MIARLIYLFIAVASLALLSLGLFYQFALRLQPCAPVVLIRYALVLTAVVAVFALALDLGRIYRIVMSAAIGLTAAAGAILAAYQSWPRVLAIDLAGLGVNLDAIVRGLPLADVLPKFFLGSGGCGGARWTILGVAGSQWAFAGFLLFIVAAFLAGRRG
jgi:disulfide bond formation protein DsbB